MSRESGRGLARIVLVASLAVLYGCGGGGEEAPAPPAPATPPPPPTYTVGGTSSGLAGTGLVLTLNGGSDLTVGAGGTFTFPDALLSGASYAVAVKSQPTGPTQTCVVSGGSGTVASASVANVAVNCTTNTYAIAGAVSGLAGSGLVLALNNAGDLAVGVNGSFTLATAVASGTTYTATVKSQPVNPSQTCTVTNASGTVGSNAVNNVSVGCTTNTYAVGGTIGGLNGTGLVLRLNGTTDLPIAANGTFAFAPPLPSGSAYAVTIQSQPTVPFQTCGVTNGTGTIGGAAPSVAVNCTNDAYSVGGTVSGLTGSGLVLQLNGGSQQVTVNADGSFLFPTLVLRGGNYDVTVKTQTSTHREVCVVNAGSGTLNSNVANVKVNCAVVLGFVYVVDSADDLVAYGIHPQTGALLPIGVVGTSPGYTSQLLGTPDGHTLYATDVLTSRIRAFTVQTSRGTLTPVGAPVATGGTTRGAHVLAMTPSGKFLYAANAWDGTVTRLSIDPGTGALTSQGVAATVSATGTAAMQDLAVTPDGAFLYVLSWLEGAPGDLTVYAIDPTSGALSAGSTITPVDAEGVTMDPLGRFLYLRHRLPGPAPSSSATLFPYSINAGTGALTPVGSGTTIVSNAARLLVEPTGRFAYALGTWNFDASQNNLQTLSIDQASGALTLIGSPVLVPGNPLSGIAVDAAGKFLFTRNYRAVFDGGAPFADGSTFRIAQSGPTLGQPDVPGNGASTPQGDPGIAVIQ